MRPNWLPLERLLGWSRCAGFMYMGRVNGINLYKHGISRTYLNLDDNGNCYVKGPPGSYIRSDYQRELLKLEKDLQSLLATLETPYDEIFIAQKRAILRQEGISLLTVQLESEHAAKH